MVEPLCPFDFKPVDREGYTCDRHCYEAWVLFYSDVEHWTDRVKLIILADDDLVPLTLTEQPWYLREFKPEDRPSIEP